MNAEIKKTILEKIKSYKTIIISRHKRPDGDAVGSTMGLYTQLRNTLIRSHMTTCGVSTPTTIKRKTVI